jgi:hypothetical protein
MPRQPSTLSLIRSLLYALARVLGDPQATRRAPDAIA